MRYVAFADSSQRAGARHVIACLGAAGALTLSLLALFASSATAELIHPTSTAAYGKEGAASSGTGIGCRIGYVGSEKRLYLWADERIYGIEITSPGTATNIPGYPIVPNIGNSFCGGPDIAVDNSGTASNGRIYVVTGGAEVNAFNPNGTKLGSPWPVLVPRACGLQTSSTGEVWVRGQSASNEIFRFASDGTQLSSVKVPGVGECQAPALDPVTNDAFGQQSAELKRYTAASSWTASTLITPLGFSSFESDIAVDGAHQQVFLSGGNSNGVTVFDAQTGEYLETIPTTEQAHGVAVDQTTGTVFVQTGAEGTGRIREFPAKIIPDVKTVSASPEGVVSGEVDPAGGGAVTECVVEYGFEQKKRGESYEHSVPCSPAPSYAAPTNITAVLTGLVGETLYHYRVVAKNGNGKGYGRDKTFTRHYVQDVVTEPADGINTSSATLHASFTGNGEDVHYYFKWGTSTSYGNTTPLTDAGSPVGHETVAVPLAGLTSDTVYHYRVVMETAKGSSAGLDQQFETSHAVQGVTTDPVTDLTGESVTLKGHWTGNGEMTHYYFEWGFGSIPYEHIVPVLPGGNGGSGNVLKAVEEPITGLGANTSFHYRLVASNGLGTSYGQEVFFTTLKFPSVEYTHPTDYSSDAVTLNAKINPNGVGATTYHFEYGPTESYGSSTAESASVGSDSLQHPASQRIEGLSPGATYHYRIVVHGPGGTTVRPDMSFTTVPLPPTIVGGNASDETIRSAQLSTNVKPGFGATVVYFEYGITTAYGLHTIPGMPFGGETDNTAHPVSEMLTNLLPDTTYHFRTVAFNFGTTVHGEDLVFRTAGPPQLGQPGLTDLAADGVSVTTTINPNRLATTYRVEYGPTINYGSASAVSTPIGPDAEDHRVTIRLGGLSPMTSYHYRVVANNEGGVTNGDDGTFSTPSVPIVKECEKGFVNRNGGCVRKPCKKGFVRRSGKCVKKQTHHKKRHHQNKAAGS